MRPLRYALNDSLDGWYDRLDMASDERHRHATALLEAADALNRKEPGTGAVALHDRPRAS
jgi:hypothetical protein